MGSDAKWNSLPGMMLGLAREWPERPMLRFWRGGGWQRMSWAEYAMAVASVAAGLRQQGVCPGDRVLLVSENRPEFLIADTAVMAIGAVTVPTYTTNTMADHAHILKDSGARAAIVSNAKLARTLAEAAGLGGLDLLVAMEAAEDTVPWADLYLRHRRRAQGGDAAAQGDAGQPARRGGFHPRAEAAGGCLLPVLPAALPRL
jgi:long-chain acyl-CoA synthetase